MDRVSVEFGMLLAALVRENGNGDILLERVLTYSSPKDQEVALTSIVNLMRQAGIVTAFTWSEADGDDDMMNLHIGFSALDS